MTYEEYKESKNKKKPSFLKRLINKLLLVIIFVMCILIACNYSPKFKEFIDEKILGDTLDFSKINKLLSKISPNNKEETAPVMEEIKENEKYLDGVKYIVNEGETINIKDSGIVTFIGEKEGYNNTIIVQQSNGYYAWYGNIKEEVKLYDYVTKGNPLGTALTNEYYFSLFKDGKAVDITNEN